MNTFILALQSTATPEAPTAEVIEQAVKIIDVWSTLGPIMAVLFVVALAILAIIVDRYFNRNSNSAAINMLANNNAQKDREIEEFKAQREQDRLHHNQNMALLTEQLTRSNDLWEANNTQGGQRILQQQRMVENQAQIANDLKTMVTTGSAPVQEIKAKVGEIFNIVSSIDARTAPWNDIVNILTPLLIELGALRTEAKKHKTQPIPSVDPPPISPEATPL